VKGIQWTNEAIIGLAAASSTARDSLFERLELIAEFPAMYPVRQRGRFAGLRFLVLQKRWIVYYRSGNEHILVIAIVPAIARPT
jgi:plasmid stabilization system protein ParE